MAMLRRPSPVLFEEACLKRQKFFPELANLLIFYARMYPSSFRGNTRQLRLSFLDQFILDGLSTEDWKRPVDIIRANQDRFLFFMKLNGDLWISSRLQDWAEHDKGEPLVRERQERGGVNSHTWRAYLLTARGQAVRDQGLKSVADAPRLSIGGCVVHDPERPWVSVVKTNGTHVAFREWPK